MKLAYLDCFSGVSGDMFLAALVANGLDPGRLEAEVRKLGIDVRLRCEQVRRGMLMAERIVVEAPQQHHHRHYTDIVARIEAAPLSPRTRQRACAVFERLGRAEAKIHGVPLERVHFHEVGALDSMADIVGACSGIELLGIDELRSSPLNVGGGSVRCDHGVLPVPAPATAELLQGVPVYSSGIQAELVTPTGAALVSVLASGFGPLPPMTVASSGCGAGSRDLGEFPNVLRLFVGTAQKPQAGLETLLLVEANLDDMNPQLGGFFAERAFAAGALDVFFRSRPDEEEPPRRLALRPLPPRAARCGHGFVFSGDHHARRPLP